MNPPPPPLEDRPPKLLDRVGAKMRLLHYPKRTERAYVDWIKRFILFHNKRHPREMGAPEIETFLTHLAVDGHVAASTQNQAFSAFLFLYQKMLKIELPKLNALRAQRPERLPVVLAIEEGRDGTDNRFSSFQAPTRNCSGYLSLSPPQIPIKGTSHCASCSCKSSNVKTLGVTSGVSG